MSYNVKYIDVVNADFTTAGCRPLKNPFNDSVW